MSPSGLVFDGSLVFLLMQYLGRCYVRHFNYASTRSGTLFEGRFKTSLVQEDNYFLTCLRYIELNQETLNIEIIAKVRHFANTGLVPGTGKFREHVSRLRA